MSLTKKGNNYHFGMKVHTGTDSQSGLAHTVNVTTASVHDKQEMEALLHGREGGVWRQGLFQRPGQASGEKEGIILGCVGQGQERKEPESQAETQKQKTVQCTGQG